MKFRYTVLILATVVLTVCVGCEKKENITPAESSDTQIQTTESTLPQGTTTADAVTELPETVGAGQEIVIDKSTDEYIDIVGMKKSDTGTTLNLIVKWHIFQRRGDDEMIVDAAAILEFHSLFVGTRENGTLSINNETTKFSSPVINAESDSLQYFALADSTTSISHKSENKISLPIDCSWYFGGYYAGNSIKWINTNINIEIQD